MSPEFLEALKLVEEYDRARPEFVKEFRVYYNQCGEVTGYCETDHPPDTNYIVIENPDVVFRNNTIKLRVVDGELKIIEPKLTRTRLAKSHTGQLVVQGIAALALEPGEQYSNTEYYDRTTND
jgi:hypothetical protein